MDISTSAYLITICLGSVVCAMMLRTPAAALGVWMSVYPLLASITVPAGLEKIPPTRVIHLAMLAILCLRGHLGGGRSLVTSLPIVYLLFTIAALLSAFLSPARGATIGRALTYAEPGVWLLLGMAAVHGHDWHGRIGDLLRGAAVGLALVVAVGIAEFAYQSNPLVDLGLGQADQDYMLDRRLGFSGRLTSSLGQPVYAGIFALVGIACVHFYVGTLPRRSPERLLLWALLLLGVAFLLLTGTRAALFGLGLYFPLAVLFRGKRSLRIPGLGLYLGAAALGLFLLPEHFLRFVGTTFDFTNVQAASANVLARAAITTRLLEIFLSYPLLGAGPGYVVHQVQRLGDVSFFGLEGVENQYAVILAENGLVGFVLAALFGILVLRACRAHSRLSEGHVAPGLGGWLAAVWVCIFAIALSCTVIRSVAGCYMMALTGFVVRLTGPRQVEATHDHL